MLIFLLTAFNTKLPLFSASFSAISCNNRQLQCKYSSCRSIIFSSLFILYKYISFHITDQFIFLPSFKLKFDKFGADKIYLFAQFLQLFFALNLILWCFIIHKRIFFISLSIFFLQLCRMATQSSDFKDSVKTLELVALSIKSSKLDSLWCLFDSFPLLNWSLNYLLLWSKQ